MSYLARHITFVLEKQSAVFRFVFLSLDAVWLYEPFARRCCLHLACTRPASCVRVVFHIVAKFSVTNLRAAVVHFSRANSFLAFLFVFLLFLVAVYSERNRQASGSARHEIELRSPFLSFILFHLGLTCGDRPRRGDCVYRLRHFPAIEERENLRYPPSHRFASQLLCLKDAS